MLYILMICCLSINRLHPHLNTKLIQEAQGMKPSGLTVTCMNVDTALWYPVLSLLICGRADNHCYEILAVKIYVSVLLFHSTHYIWLQIQFKLSVIILLFCDLGILHTVVLKCLVIVLDKGTNRASIVLKIT